MEEFKITDERLNAISKLFNADHGTIKQLHKLFLDVLSGVKNHYLVDITRSMEAYLQKVTNNSLFRIICEPFQDPTYVSNVACAYYYPKKLILIMFSPRINEKQLRISLASKLGHLFLIELNNNKKGSVETLLNEKAFVEPFSSIFGIFTIMDKNDFYANHARKLNHHSWDDIIKDFIHLNKINVSGASHP
jgi:hypothetical protein